MKLTRTRRTVACEVNITPLIDIVFLLIIFSMVVSQFTKLEVTNVVLPEAHEGVEARLSGGGRIVVNVLPTGRMVVAGTGHSTGSLGEVLSAEAARRGAANVSVVIRSDRQTPWASVAPILRACADRRIDRVRVAVRPPAASPES